MNIKDFKAIFQEPIVSVNNILKYIFIFNTDTSGRIESYDSSLGVSITADWELNSREPDIYINIKGFDGLGHPHSGLVCKIEDLKNILVVQTSAYDLVGE